MNLLSNDHGTTRALHRHRLYGTPVCDACLDWQCQREQTAADRFMAIFRRRTERLPMANPTPARAFRIHLNAEDTSS